MDSAEINLPSFSSRGGGSSHLPSLPATLDSYLSPVNKFLTLRYDAYLKEFAMPPPTTSPSSRLPSTHGNRTAPGAALPGTWMMAGTACAALCHAMHSCACNNCATRLRHGPFVGRFACSCSGHCSMEGLGGSIHSLSVSPEGTLRGDIELQQLDCLAQRRESVHRGVLPVPTLSLFGAARYRHGKLFDLGFIFARHHDAIHLHPFHARAPSPLVVPCTCILRCTRSLRTHFALHWKHWWHSAFLSMEVA